MTMTSAAPPMPTRSRPARYARRALAQLFLARMRAYFREPAVLFWTYGFPLFLAIGLGVAFAEGQPQPVSVAIAADGNDPEGIALKERLSQWGIQAWIVPEDKARLQLRNGTAALVVLPDRHRYQYVFDPTRSDSLIARYRVDALVQRWKAGPSAWATYDHAPDEPGTRYIDYLLPGLIGLNLMGGGLWAVGYVIVDFRVRKLLKRLQATPMRRTDFLLALVGGRLAFLVPEVLFLLAMGWLLFGTPVRGHIASLILVAVLGGAAFASLGLLLACRASHSETIAGVINLVMIPMWMFSGTFFSANRFPTFIQWFARALPLTQVNEALRGVMLDGATLRELTPQLALMACWALVPFALAVRWFRWQ